MATPFQRWLQRFLQRLTLDRGAGMFTGSQLYKIFRPEPWNESVSIAKAASYDDDLESVISGQLVQLGFKSDELRGKHVMLKPNLVETASSRSSCINTHPRVMRAATLAFLKLGAARVTFAEGAGHRRDSMILLEQSGLIDVMKETGAKFVDLNFCDTVPFPNVGGTTKIKSFMLPKLLKEADFIVSMAKLKTHHWAGVTLSMKNLYGVVPGAYYGWPKNVLHFAGLQRSIYDIASTAGAHFTIIDGIIGMEGDGPILGDAKHAGVIVAGRNLPAVDATCCRVMGIDPHWIYHLAACPFKLGPIDRNEIIQKGEPIESVQTEFKLLEHIHIHRGMLKLRRTKTMAGNTEMYGKFTY